jgi:ferric-dicitrate binding protein FerR (iron transport regulator)
MANDPNRPDQTGEDKSLESLLQLAGERAEIPLSIESRVYHRVQEEWRASTTKPNGDRVYAEVQKTWRRNALRTRVLRWLAPVGVAVSAVLVFVLLSQPEVTQPVAVATVASVVAPSASPDAFQEGAVVYEGDLVSTGPGGGVSLTLARNVSLRIDENTRLQVDGADRFTLLTGHVYADTGQFIYRDGGLEIDTAFGVVSDIGTQFAVSVGDESLEVSVREGRVELASATDSLAARMGERLTVAQGQGASVSRLDTFDPYWDWIADLTPAFDMTNKSLLDFLKWASRETGRELRFATDEARMFAMRTDVHGSVDGLTPDETLAAILSTTSLEYQIELDKVVLDHRSLD